MQLLVHPPTSLLTLDLMVFVWNLEEAVSLLQILLGSLKKGSESAGACVSQCISCGLPLVYTSHMLPYAALGSPSHLPPDIRPYGFCLKFGGGSFTFADTPRELEKRERERRCLCESVYVYIYIHDIWMIFIYIYIYIIYIYVIYIYMWYKYMINVCVSYIMFCVPSRKLSATSKVVHTPQVVHFPTAPHSLSPIWTCLSMDHVHISKSVANVHEACCFFKDKFACIWGLHTVGC